MRFLTSFVNTHRRSLTMFVSIVTIAVLYNNFVDGNGNAPHLPVVVGHRGSCGIYPEHTEISYEKAAEMGSDYIECDVQITKDMQIVCSHEAWIKEVCDIENHPEFSDRISTYNFDDDDPNFNWNDKGDIKDNYFTFDFTLEELQTLKRKQISPDRDPNFNWKYSFVSFDEFSSIAKSRGVGIAPEIKSPTALNKIFKQRNLTVTAESLVLSALTKHGYTGPNDKCLLQCFELSTLERMKGQTELKRLFLLKRLAKTDDDTLQRAQKADISSIGLDKELLVSTAENGYIDKINQDLLDRIHNLGMQVYAYTFKNELPTLKWDYRGDMRNELHQFYQMGLDGYFSDFPNTVRSYLNSKNCSSSIFNSSTINRAVAMVILIALLLTQ